MKHAHRIAFIASSSYSSTFGYLKATTCSDWRLWAQTCRTAASQQRYSSSANSPARKLRLMPLGGSITYGSKSSHGNGYRKALYDLLVADGYHVEMVGSRRAGSMTQNSTEGWRGFRIEQIQSKAKASAARYRPDVITLNAGSNDSRQGFDVDCAGARLGEMLDCLWDSSPNSAIILSTLVTTLNNETDKVVQNINTQIIELANKQIKANRKLVLVDMHADDGPQLDDLADGTHPNDVGYAKMAKIWHRGIIEAATKGYIS